MNGNVGKNLRLHPAATAPALFAEKEHGKINMWQGPMMTAYSPDAPDWEGGGYGPMVSTPPVSFLHLLMWSFCDLCGRFENGTWGFCSFDHALHLYSLSCSMVDQRLVHLQLKLLPCHSSGCCLGLASSVLLQSVYGLLEMLQNPRTTLCSLAQLPSGLRQDVLQMLLASTVIACLCTHSYTDCNDESICVLQHVLIMAVWLCCLVYWCKRAVKTKPQDAACSACTEGSRVYRTGLDTIVRQACLD